MNVYYECKGCQQVVQGFAASQQVECCKNPQYHLVDRPEPYKPIPPDHYLANVARELLGLNALMSEEDMLQHATTILSEGKAWVLARMYRLLQEARHDRFD